jgi:hypothetical protein
MSRTIKGGSRRDPLKAGTQPGACVFAPDANATLLLQGCPVVTAKGEMIGKVKSILHAVKTRQLRYVMLSLAGGTTAVAIPWEAVYFDSALARLVFYTYS